ncbi:hypothetical protein [Pseudomonas sp. LB3P38]|uniref:hypothetical protein n=1 Tax=Pseudomonas lyxosi TaxID=3398358 RepID=UPI0039EE4877
MAGQEPLVTWGFSKSLAVKAKPPAAITAETDMYSDNKTKVGYQAAFAKNPVSNANRVFSGSSETTINHQDQWL